MRGFARFVGSSAFALAWWIACASSGDKSQQPPAPDAATQPRCGDGVCAASEVGACSSDCGSPTTPVCGNSTCEASESASSCPADCAPGVCGDGTCTAPENSMNCPGDCGAGGGSGSGSGSGTAVCGNLICEAGETAASCAADCGSSTSTCPNGDDVGCFFCWFDPTQCIPPQTEAICEQCLGLGP